MYQSLIAAALKARSQAYVPYSHFAVGAALLGKDGKIYTGCNIENGSYGLTNCAERTAFFKAVSEGMRGFEAIAICGGPEGREPNESCPPCGACRQVMGEFCAGGFKIILCSSTENYQIYTLDELLPMRFDRP